MKRSRLRSGSLAALLLAPAMASVGVLAGCNRVEDEKAIEETAEEVRSAGRELRDTARDLGSAGREAGRELRAASREARRELRSAGRELRAAGDELREAGRQVGEASREVGRAIEPVTQELLGDAAVTARIKAKLLADPEVAGLDIDVDTVEGRVALSGWAASRDQSAEAEKLARRTEGVRSVVNRIEIGQPPQR